MEYARLGRTGATVSRIGFGGAAIGLGGYLEAYDPHDPTDRSAAIDAIHAALDGGINYFDTAAAYGKGESERILGEGLQGVASAGGHPLFVASKVHPRQFADDVRGSLSQSLERLRRDRIDLLQIHGDSITKEDADRWLEAGGMIEQLLRAKQEGLVSSIGFTTEDNNESVYRLIETGVFDTLQLCYNFLFQHPYESTRPFGSMFAAEHADMGIVTMRAPTSGTFQRWIAAVNPADTFDYTPALIQFVLSNPLVDVALVGMRTPAIVAANLAIADDLDGRIDIAAIQERFV